MTEALLAAAIAATVGGAAQAVTGFGFALVAIPLLSLVVPAQLAVVTVTVVSAVLTAGAAAREWRQVERHVATLATAAAVAGMPLGLLAFVLLPARALTAAVAAVALAFLLLSEIQRRTRISGGTPIVAGFVSGAALTSTGMNGPPLVAALQALRLAPRQQRATLQAIFTWQDVVAVGLFYLAGQTTDQVWLAAAAALPGAALGWLVGDHFFRRLPERQARRVVTVMLLTTVAALILRVALS